MQSRKFLICFITMMLIVFIPGTCFAGYNSTTDYTVLSPAANSGSITYSKGETISLKGVIGDSLDEVVCGLAPYNTELTDLYTYGFSHYIPNKTAFSYLGNATTSETDVSNGQVSILPGATYVNTTVTSTIDTANVATGSYRFFILMVYGNGYGMSYFYQDIDIVNPAIPTSATVYVDGQQKDFQAYNVDGSNYFKLRDLAYCLNGTKKQFNVSWDSTNNAIALTKNSTYSQVGGEMTGKGTEVVTPIEAGANIYLDSVNISLFTYNIKNNNYFKLRDIAEIFDFNVDWDSVNKAIKIDTTKSYSNE